MGNANSNPFRVCRSLKKKNPNENDDSTVTDSAIVQRNRDKYFNREDYDKIMEKYPLFKEWIDESTNPQSKDRPKQRKIRFREAEVIGLGSYGRVIMGLNVENGCLMATKQVQLGNGNNPPAQQEKIKSLQMEIELLSRFSHKNIVRYYGAQKNKNTFNIFLEYVSGGTIASLLDKYGPFNENLIKLYVRQILEGLEYLHVRNTIHRDIKGANILVDNNGVCKLADFGTATKISGLLDMDSDKIASIKGTVRWMAPEVIKQNSLGRFCDIWSVGCTVIEMATAKPPWHNVIKANSNSISTLYQIAQAKTPPPLPKGLSPEAIDFLKQCFKINPQERPNVIKLLQHKFVSGIEPVYPCVEAGSKEPQKPNNKGIVTKSIAQADMNPNQNFKSAYTEVTSKVFSRQHSAASPSIKSNHEVHAKDKMVELEHKSSFAERQKDPETGNEGPAEKKMSIDDKINSTTTTPQQNLQKGKTPKTLNGKKYLVQKDGPEVKSEESPETSKEKSMGESENAKSKAKRGAITLDLRKNEKIMIAPRPLGQSPGTSPYTKEFFNGKSNKLSDINCFLEGESDSSSRDQLERGKVESEDDGMPVIGMRTSSHKSHSSPKRPESRETIQEGKEDIEEAKDKFEEKKDMKRSQEKKWQQTHIRINIPEKDEKEEDNSDSKDSDRDPSVASSSMLKPSETANVIENNGSFSTHNIEGRNMRVNIHDQSSRLSFRKDTSFDGKNEHGSHPEGGFQPIKPEKLRTQSEVLKSNRMGLSGSIKKDGNVEKSPGNWSLMIPEGDGVVEGKKMVKKKQDKDKDKDKTVKKTDNDNEYLQNFNLLDDLNKVYGQLEATSPPINLE